MKFRTHLATLLIKFFAIIVTSLTIIFIIPRLVPGDPIAALLAQMEYTASGVAEYEAIIEAYKVMFGLDGSILTQYVRYFQQLFVGNLGVSVVWFPTSVNYLISRALPWTIGLLSVTTLISWVIGTFIGVIAGWFRDSKKVTILTSVAIGFGIIPYYVLAILAMFVFAYVLGYFPLGAHELVSEVAGLNLEYLVILFRNTFLPALCLVLGGFSRWVLGMRGMIISVMEEDYVKFAELKGLKKSVVLAKYAFRNALLPQVTGLGIALGWIIGGALITEIIFGFPGMGSLLFDAVKFLDYNTIQGIVVVMTTTVCSATLILDLVYPLIDPRIRYDRA